MRNYFFNGLEDEEIESTPQFNRESSKLKIDFSMSMKNSHQLLCEEMNISISKTNPKSFKKPSVFGDYEKFINDVKIKGEFLNDIDKLEDDKLKVGFGVLINFVKECIA